MHRGVYAVGHRVLSAEGRWLAAVHAVGDDAVLSHRSAASLWEIARSDRAAIDVTVARTLRRRPGLALHCSQVPEDESTTHRGIPVTTVARTLLDCAAVMPVHRLEYAINQAEYRRLGDRPSLAELLARHPSRSGARRLGAILDAGGLGERITRSELEDRFLEFLRHSRLPRPQLNATVKLADRTVEADCAWRDPRLIVELDGRAAHDSAGGFERDRARDRALQVERWRVVRVTWRQLRSEPAALARDLGSLLGAQGFSNTRR